MRTSFAAAFAPALLGLALAGCPPDPGPRPPQGEGDPAPPASADTPAPPPPPADPLAGSVFSKEQLFELYRAEQKGGAERERVLREHRLLDQGGQEIPARVKAYEAALQQYARNDPQGWSDFVETLPR